MSRSTLVALGFVVAWAAAPARGQGLLEAIGEAIEASIDQDGGEMHGHDQGGHFHPNNGGFNNSHHPHHPNMHYDKVWDGDHWDYIPHVTHGPSNNVVYPNGNVVYPNGNVVYPNSSVVYPNSSVTYPSTTVVSPATTVTSVTPNALPYKGPGVTIKLEEEVGGSVNYTIDGKESATIQAGQQQTLTSKGRYEIRFSRGRAEDGRDFGQARYTITEGNYHFTVTDNGWELLRDKDQPNIVTSQVQPASPSGIKTNTLPPKSAPVATPPAAGKRPTANAIPTLRADSFSPAAPGGTR